MERRNRVLTRSRIPGLEEILELDAAGISGVLAEHLAEEGIVGAAARKQALSDTALNNVNLRRGSATSIGWVRRVVLDYSPELGVRLIASTLHHFRPSAL